jgi:hypothetical protein
MMSGIPWPNSRTIGIGIVAFVGLVSLVTLQATTHAAPRQPLPLSAAAAAEGAHGPLWVPEVVTAPGLPLQCADGAWTRTVVRGGCARHGGVAF